MKVFTSDRVATCLRCGGWNYSDSSHSPTQTAWCIYCKSQTDIM